REALAGRNIYKAKGCAACLDTGYSGRMGVHEIMLMDDDVRAMVMKNADAPTVKRQAMEKGMKTLREVAADKVLQGETTIEEIMRVTQEDVARA
ncbi:MAG TPA: type II secretion system protein GspE, partial [bacterium]|nr:type II secretion system protein GspE [bacterium]